MLFAAEDKKSMLLVNKQDIVFSLGMKSFKSFEFILQ